MAAIVGRPGPASNFSLPAVCLIGQPAPELPLMPDLTIVTLRTFGRNQLAARVFARLPLISSERSKDSRTRRRARGGSVPIRPRPRPPCSRGHAGPRPAARCTLRPAAHWIRAPRRRSARHPQMSSVGHMRKPRWKHLSQPANDAGGNGTRRDNRPSQRGNN